MIGRTLWAIPEGYIPSGSTGEGPALESHETICVLNPNDLDAQVELTLFFPDREPVGPYRLIPNPADCDRSALKRRRPSGAWLRGTCRGAHSGARPAAPAAGHVQWDLV